MNLINISNEFRTISLFCRDSNGRLDIKTINSFFPYFYVLDPNGQYQSFKGESLRKIIVSAPHEVKKTRPENSWESDILFCRRYLIDKVDKIDKTIIKYCFIDIETLSSKVPNVNKATLPISCISVYNSMDKSIQTFFLGDYANDRELIEDFICYMKKECFDIWLSWFVTFDYDYLYNRYNYNTGENFAEAISPIGKNRYGKADMYYPAGISIVDYLQWFKAITLNKERQYTLDYIAEQHLGKGKTHSKVDFSKVSEEVKLRNIEDVRIMSQLEEKKKLIPYFDEIRRLAKIEWEDLYFNSRVIDMLLLEEAKNQNVVLPMKPSGDEKIEYEGAFRESYNQGFFKSIIKCDLSSAYPVAIMDFCLDPANIIEQENTDTTSLIQIENNIFKQNPNALLPTVVKKLLTLKVDIKKKMSTLKINTEEYETTEQFYVAIKSVVNSSYGVCGNRFFRLFDSRVASATTYIVRELLKYIKTKVEEGGYQVLYIDTDSVYITGNEDITPHLNDLIKQWYKDRWNKDNPTMRFEFEGIFEQLIVLAKCRYKGWLRTPKGDLKVEIKGIEAKRKDSTVLMQKFQTELLEKIRVEIPKDEIFEWIRHQIKDIKNIPLHEISFPCRLGKPVEEYKNLPIFIRAINNTPGFEKKIGDAFYYIYVTPDEEVDVKTVIKSKVGSEITYETLILDKDLSRVEGIEYARKTWNVPNLDSKLISVLHKKDKPADVVAFDEDNFSHIDKFKIDWKRMLERNIYMKLVSIFEAMSYDFKEIMSDEEAKTYQNKKNLEEESKDSNSTE